MTAATPWAHVEAEAVSGGSSTEKTPAQKDDGGEGEAKVCCFNWIYESINTCCDVLRGSRGYLDREVEPSTCRGSLRSSSEKLADNL